MKKIAISPGNHVELESGLADQASVSKIRMRAEWPSGLGLKYRSYDLPPGQLKTQAGWTSLEWQFADPAPFVSPTDSPARFQLGRRIDPVRKSDRGGWRFDLQPSVGQCEPDPPKLASRRRNRRFVRMPKRPARWNHIHDECLAPGNEPPQLKLRMRFAGFEQRAGRSAR